MNATLTQSCVEREQRQVTPASQRATLSFECFPAKPNSVAAKREEALAAGVFSQAAYDLRRFHTATSGIERELYLDAYSWIIANDFSWPSSFVNVCELLGACPETIREELLADVSLGWFGYWVKLTARKSRLLRASFIRVFQKPRNTISRHVASSTCAPQYL